MKHKKTMIAAGITIIAGTVYYFLAERSKRKTVQSKLYHLSSEGEEKIRQVMHNAKAH